MLEFPTMSGGNSSLTVDYLNRLIEQIARSGNLTSVPPVIVEQGPGGWTVRLDMPLGIWAKITERYGNGEYAWEEQVLGGDKVFSRKPAGQFGGGDGRLAVELNRSNSVEVGSIVYLMPGLRGHELAPMMFVAPVADSKDKRLIFWGKITEERSGVYGYLEQEINNGEFMDRQDGLSASAIEASAAVEANGLSGVPLGSIVLIYTEQARQYGSDGDRTQRFLFRYAAGSVGFWAKLTPVHKNNKYEVVLDGPDAGNWSLTFTDNETEDAEPVVASDIPASAEAAVVQAALDDAFGEDVVLVTGSPETKFEIEFVGEYGGEYDLELEFDGSALTYDEEDEEEDEEEAEDEEEDEAAEDEEDEDVEDLDEEEEAEAPYMEQVQVGKDTPFKDGNGAYSWSKIEYSEQGYPVEDVAGTHSTWPIHLANETAGEGNVPIGTVVWMTVGPTIIRNRDDVADDDFFADTEDEEIDEYLEDSFADDEGTLVNDVYYRFTWSGSISFWARVTTEADSTGKYTLQEVAMEDAEPEEEDDAEEGEEDEEDVLEDFDEDYADELIEDFFTGSDEYKTYAHETSVKRKWVDTEHKHRLITCDAYEVDRRTDVPVGTIVRVWVNQRNFDPVYEFQGPPSGFWATITSTVSASEGVYNWTALYPPTNLETGEVETTAATGTAYETSKCPWVPAGVKVWLERPMDTLDYRFRYAPDWETRMIRYDGSGTATLEANPIHPHVGTGTGTVTTWPTDNASLLRAGHYYLAYTKAPWTHFVVPIPIDVANERNVGAISAGDQMISYSAVTFANGLYLDTAAGTTANGLTPPTTYHQDTESTIETHQFKQAKLYTGSDGSPVVQHDGSTAKMTIASNLFDLTGDCYSTSYLGFQVNSLFQDGLTGTFSLPTPHGTATITFSGGLFMGYSGAAAFAGGWSGSFTMDKQIPGGSTDTCTVTVVNGRITSAVDGP